MSSPPGDDPLQRSANDGSDPFAGYEIPRRQPAGRPWTIANMVMGLDGSLAWRGRVGTLSSEADRSLFVRLRGLADAVMVGAGTVRAEGYGPVRLPESRQEARISAGRSAVPPLVVVSRSLDLDWEGPLWTAETSSPPMVVTAAGASPEALALARDRAEVVVAGEGSVDLPLALAMLADRGMRVVLTEGGPTLLDELVECGVLDELCLTLTPAFGGDPLTMAHRARALDVLAAFTLEGVVRRGDELYLRYLVLRSGDSSDG
jgi:riboflavin biosynthesis pyrimidine reductase